MPLYIKQSKMPVSAEKLFNWHKNSCALERLTPPSRRIKVLRKDLGLTPGSEVHLRIYIGPIPFKWIARHIHYIEGKEFTDSQITGPFTCWSHTHRMIPKGDNQSLLEDKVEYQMKSKLANNIALHSIENLFCYRHNILRRDLEIQNHFPSVPLRIALTGASGLVGSDLSAFLRSAGHTVLSIVRRPQNEDEILWDVKSGKIETEKLEGVDAVIHLAGENIGSGWWTKEKKKKIEESRTLGTALLVKGLNSLKSPPKVLISTSALGYYGIDSNIVANEQENSGKGFLAQVCRNWETEARGFNKGRVVVTRFGIVLTPKGGVLKKMLLPFKLGLGGKMGSGKQLISWISMDDLIYQLYRLLLSPSIDGPVNLCTPKFVSNLEFSKTLASVLNRPCLFPTPAFLATILFGEMAKETMLSSIGATPKKLEEAKLPFHYPDLFSALKHLLEKS